MKIFQIIGLIFGFVIWGNAQKADLTGSVYDAYGAVILKAKVTAVNEKGEEFVTFTNENGVYILNLPYNSYSSQSRFKVAKYKLTVDRQDLGFEKFVLKDFKFVPSYKGQMSLDFALDVINPEPCGYAGADCLESPMVETTKEVKLSNNIFKKTLVKLPKRKIKLKGKIINK